MKAHANFKINLGLHITRKRDDGFHDLETIFYPIDTLQDIIEMEPAEEVVFEMRKGDFQIDSEKNLCVKAFRMLQKEFGLRGARITLEKNIPSGAGLGGGSSDAATVLKMSNELFNLQLANELLKKFAEKLGSDVPFFIENRPCYATGKGENLSPIPLDLSAKTIKIFKPDFSISTAEAYSLITPKSGRRNLKEIVGHPIENWKNLLVNDFEAPLFKKYPELAEIKKKFYNEGAIFAALSGSGSAIFGIFDN